MKKSASSCWALITIFMRTTCSSIHAGRFVYQGFLFQCCFCSIYLFILSNKGWGGRLNERPEFYGWKGKRIRFPFQERKQKDQIPGQSKLVQIQWRLWYHITSCHCKLSHKWKKKRDQLVSVQLSIFADPATSHPDLRNSLENEK